MATIASDEPTSVYTLNHGIQAIEGERLEKQHEFLKGVTKTLLPENVQKYLLGLGHGPALVDIGCGTGIWLKHLARELPSNSRLDGYDYDTSKFAEATSLPSNVNLGFADALKPFPENIRGTYDVVHVRFMFLAIKADQWELVAANLKSLLRSGGWLVWEEGSYPTWTCMPMTEACQKWLNIEIRHAYSLGRDIFAPIHLPEQVSNQGFVNVSRQVFETWKMPIAIQRVGSRVFFAIGEQSLHAIVNSGGFDWLKTHEQVDELVKQWKDDLDNERAIGGVAIYWVIAQNPPQ
ncbi:S-adenosyl-L-methionine-dependent methyltransferase [Trichoderma velutinum]